MALIVCPKCGIYHDRKINMCPTCQFNMAETKKIEKIVLEIHNEFRKKSPGFGKRKELDEICQKTGMNIEISRKFLENMEHPKDFVYAKNFSKEKETAKNKNTEKVVEQKTASQDTYKKGGLFTKIKCPKCWSIEFEVVDTKKKFSLRKALVGNTVGGLALGPAGAIAGTFQGVNGKNGKTKFICLHCGKVWEQKI